MATEDFVRDHIDVQMPDPASPDTPMVIPAGKRAGQGDVQENIGSFLFEPGPADVTAYHDFYNLQIAFESIWTEVFDGALEKQAKRLYEETVSIQHFPIFPFGLGRKIESIIDLEAYLDDLKDFTERVESEEEPAMVYSALGLVVPPEKWSNVDPYTQMILMEKENEAAQWRALIDEYREQIGQQTIVVWEGIIYRLRDEARQILAHIPTTVRTESQQPAQSRKPNKLSRLKDTIRALSARLAGRYKFDIFAPNSINFGILVNYRQEWKPGSFQVGDLVSTIPLAPKEVRKFTSKRVVKKSRAVKEIENSLQIKKRDAADTARTNAEIVRKAENKTNFKLSAEGGFSVGVANASASTGLTIDTASSSAQTKKDFREAVRKAAEEYKQERKLEINTTESEEFEETTSGEISNPNDELPVTYLFYELQRQYEIREEIHRVTPVILVANSVPAPNDIDEDWLIAHDWILRRVILDDSFVPALDFVAESVVGDEFSIEVLRDKMNLLEKLVEENKTLITAKQEEKTAAIEELEQRIAARASLTARDEDEERIEAARQMADAARETLDNIKRELRDLQSELGTAVTAMEAATDKYNQALKDHFNRQTEIARLRLHIKDNILYYMQAIWDHEPPDQRFFRLWDIDVPQYSFETVYVPVLDPDVLDLGISLGEFRLPGDRGTIRPVGLTINTPVTQIKVTYKKLYEVADLDNLLGYKGNYMIFPLKESNYITTYMMLPYVDPVTGLRDPDEAGNYNLDEIIEHIKYLKGKDPGALTDEVIAEYRQLLKDLMTTPRQEAETIVVPTDSLYIEALPGKHPLLEDFKLAHRALDVKKVQAEVRHAELENIRLAARLMEGEREDPDIEKRVIVSGDGVTPTIETGSEA